MNLALALQSLIRHQAETEGQGDRLRYRILMTYFSQRWRRARDNGEPEAAYEALQCAIRYRDKSLGEQTYGKTTH